MNLHEFQAKDILSGYGVRVPEGRVAWTPEEAESIAREVSARKTAVKAQVHAGGRGKAGGVQLAATSDSVRAIAANLLGRNLVTDQTGPAGIPVRRVYVEAAVDSERDIYLAALVDRQHGKLVLMGSPEGGEDIEERAAADPDILEKLFLDPAALADADFAGFAERLNIFGATAEKAAVLFKAVAEAFVDLDASLIEINPLAVSAEGDLLALDVKMVLDDNALFRHPDLSALRDEEEQDKTELEAQRHEINFLQMDGNIGVVVNGAGLALATHDLLQDAGGDPANFMDIRTTATSMQIARGLDLVLENPHVKALLVNIHGGGMTPCDTVAEAIGFSVRRTGRTIPMVVRFAGNSADYARKILDNCGVDYIDARDMADAVDRVVGLSGKEAR